MPTDLEFLQVEADKMPVTPPNPLVSDYVQGHRVMPTNSPFPGFWDNKFTPYLIELMDNMSPFSPVNFQSIMKGAQIGVTAAMENVIAYYMDEVPTDIVYVSSTDKFLQKWVNKRLEPLIDSCGIRPKIFAQTTSKKSRRSGDLSTSKQFVGGNLDMASAQSPGSMRGDSYRVMILDEVDGAPKMLKTEEGIWIDVMEARANAWNIRKKISRFSTPTTEKDSIINKKYKDGDKRKYMVPCLHCGVHQELKFKHIKPTFKDNVMITVYYECPECEKHIYNHHKTEMLADGYWKATATSSVRTHRSYHISSLYSPVGMLSWYELYEKYLEAIKEPEGLRSFYNLYLGLPFREKGARPKLEKVIELRGNYQEREVPDGVLFITAAVDVQDGSATDPNNPPRLEMEIVGHGRGYRTWSLFYGVWEGSILDPYDGAWEDMYQWAMDGGLQFTREDGMEFFVDMVFIDSTNGRNYGVVYIFCDRWGNTFPVKGFGQLQARAKKGEKADGIGSHNFKRYRRATTAKSGAVSFYEISTNYYKTNIYNNLTIERRVEDPQKPGFCDFPIDRSEKYFRMLTAEEKLSDGSFEAGGRRNESLDCRVYAMCAGDVYLDAQVMDGKAHVKANGGTSLQVDMVNHQFILDQLEVARGRAA